MAEAVAIADPRQVSDKDQAYRRFVDGRLQGLRVNRWSWWTHWRELADFLLPRRYKWLVTPNQMSRGSPINQHILDSCGTLAARNLASGLVSGVSSPTRPWFKLKVGRIDSTQTSPTSLWLAEVERLMMLVFHESNFYTSIAILYYDLVVYGTAAMIIYEDYDNVVHCFNPCLGEFYVDCDGKLRPVVLYREFTYNVSQLVNEFGYENCSRNVQQVWDNSFSNGGEGLSREIVVAHAIEPNVDPQKFGFSDRFTFREVYWELGGTAGLQAGGSDTKGFLRKRGFYEQPNITIRWDLVSNDPYGRSPGMDALPDVKQLQLEVRRKAQGIDKAVNPPMVADIQLKNQPASLLPGGTTYVSGFSTSGNAGFAPAYGNWRPDISAMSEDLKEVRARIQKTFFNDLLQTASQFETRSNITAVEWDMRKSESLVMLGPVLQHIHGGLGTVIERVFAIMNRARLFPPPPEEIAGASMTIEYISMLSTAQAAAATTGIERTLGLAGNLAAVDPAVLDNIDLDFALDKFSSLMNNDPRMTRSPEALAAIRDQRAKARQAQQQQEQAMNMVQGAEVLSNVDVGGGQNALQKMTGM